jgi:L-methionine (R)-S-oxide reductase
MRNGELVLGPFQGTFFSFYPKLSYSGKPACIRIKVGRGVCGTTVANKKSMVSHFDICINSLGCA